jgi:hypothetical protein
MKSGVEVKKERSYTSNPPLCLLGVKWENFKCLLYSVITVHHFIL